MATASRLTLPRILQKATLAFCLAVAMPVEASSALHAEDNRWGIDEFRFGVLKHQIENSPDEEGIDINAEVLFNRLTLYTTGNKFIDYWLTPRPDIGVTINTSGDTSQLYAGFTWDLKLTDRIFFETSFGGAVHNGALDDDHTTQYGCRVNFRESAGLGFNLSEHWDMLIEVDHMSNAGLCSENRGLTNAGIKFGYKW